jgi:hypothetical protein
MTCEECAKSTDEMRETIDKILVSQTQMQAQVAWIVETVNGLKNGFEAMMKAGGPLQMIKELRKAKG